MTTARARAWHARVAPFLPALLTLLLILLSLMPSRFFPMAEITPLLALGSVYYWVLFKPRLLPLWIVFVLGLAQDSLSGLPLGLTSFLSLLFWLVAASQRRIITRQTFWTVWFAFTLMAAGYVLLYWLLLSTSYGVRLPLAPACLQWALTVGCYPPLHLLSTRVYARLPK